MRVSDWKTGAGQRLVTQTTQRKRPRCRFMGVSVWVKVESAGAVFRRQK